jgi:hypothetical protein
MTTHLTHKLRYSDSSLYDDVCEWCGATDARCGAADDPQKRPCPRAPDEVKKAVARIAEIDQMFETASNWGSWMSSVGKERKYLVNKLKADHGLILEHKYERKVVQTAGNVVPPVELFDLPNQKPYGESTQLEARRWAKYVFGEEVADDVLLRTLRFAEEAVELTQACGLARSDIHKMVDIVYDRPVGVVRQEVGGVMLTLLVLCSAPAVDVLLDAAVSDELARVWTPELIAKVRARQATKPVPTR